MQIQQWGVKKKGLHISVCIVCISKFAFQCPYIYVCFGEGCISVCVFAFDVETIVQTVQIYLYANWILVKRFEVSPGLSPLAKGG